MKIATTFGASHVDDPKLYNEGVLLGRFLAENGYTVKCGGYGGLMEAVSKGVKEANGKIIGITLEYFDQRRPKNPYLSKKITTNTLFDRLRFLIEDSELFIVQSGSIGTLNELFMVWVLKYALGYDFRIAVIGKEYQSLKNCEFIPKERLKEIEIYENLEKFKKSFIKKLTTV